MTLAPVNMVPMRCGVSDRLQSLRMFECHFLHAEQPLVAGYLIYVIHTLRTKARDQNPKPSLSHMQINGTTKNTAIESYQEYKHSLGYI